MCMYIYKEEFSIIKKKKERKKNKYNTFEITAIIEQSN